jgi:hypothetical protein
MVKNDNMDAVLRRYIEPVFMAQTVNPAANNDSPMKPIPIVEYIIEAPESING